MILITGGTGLVGAHLLLQLADGDIPLRALYRREENIAKTKNLFTYYDRAHLFENIEWIQGDIVDVPSLEDAFKGVTHVYHCAALVSFDPNDEDKLRKVNIEGTANMVNLSLAYGIAKFCYVSSIAALGDTRVGGQVIDEETEWNPEKTHGDYALTKHGAEMEVWRAWQEGLKVVIVNPGIIFGYGFWHQGSSRILQAVRKEQRFYTNGTSGTVAVEDVVKVIRLLMASEISGERYTVVAENMSYRKVLDILSDGMSKKRPSIYASPLMTSMAWRLDWLISKLSLKKRTFTRAMAKSSHTQEKFDNSKLASALNFQFTDMELYLKNLAEKFISSL
ncbi:MAG: NAD-dependent epimerase/dehydratase family protein [Flavobacterium sp.]|nr:MAG: NAD-dependent epimerase/dehydratase family protein [Flavobacterium sp.]